jgi:three-Cys-motif partner protein
MATKQRGKGKISDIERLKSKLESLTKIGRKISEKCPGPHYSARKWTPLKLICLMYYVDTYSRIMSAKREKLGLQQIIYIDPLAGSGTNFIQDTKDVIAGSVPISIVFSDNLFDRYFFAEKDSTMREALHTRLDILLHSQKGKYVIKKDCNQLLDKLSSYMRNFKAKIHFLMFIDCEGLEVKWKFLKEVLRYPGDLIFVFQTKEIMEQRNRWGNEKALTDFYGSEVWKNANDEEDFIDIYKEQIKAIETIDRRKREAIDTLSIRSSKGGADRYSYDIIFAAPVTKGGNPWFWRLLPYLKQRITNYTGDAIKIALDVLAGRSSQIDWFC